MLVSLAASALLAAFLVWRFRSPLLLALVAVPLLAATVAGYAATIAVYGAVHAIALGFGMTMLGVAVDYPLLLLTLRRGEERLAETGARIWPSLRLAACAAAAGLLAMLGSGLPGLVQLGLFAGTGLVVAALVTRWVLPALVPEGARIAARPLPGLAGGTAEGAARAARPGWRAARRRDRGAGRDGRPCVAARPRRAQPGAGAQQALDGELRAQLGAPDVRGLLVVGPAASEAEALRGMEGAVAAVQPLIARGLLTGLEAPTRWLPSPEAQRARQSALPDRAALEGALEVARAGLPFRAAAFGPFLSAVEESRGVPALTPRRSRRARPPSPPASRRCSPAMPRAPGPSRRPRAWPTRWRSRPRSRGSACRA
jgi:predicted exporter